MCSHRQPDDVALASMYLRAVREDRAAISGPRHLETPRHSLDTLDSQGRSKLSTLNIGNEVSDRRLEYGALLAGQFGGSTKETLRRLVCRQDRRWLQRGHEIFAALEPLCAPRL